MDEQVGIEWDHGRTRDRHLRRVRTGAPSNEQSYHNDCARDFFLKSAIGRTLIKAVMEDPACPVAYLIRPVLLDDPGPDDWETAGRIGLVMAGKGTDFAEEHVVAVINTHYKEERKVRVTETVEVKGRGGEDDDEERDRVTVARYRFEPAEDVREFYGKLAIPEFPGSAVPERRYDLFETTREDIAAIVRLLKEHEKTFRGFLALSHSERAGYRKPQRANPSPFLSRIFLYRIPGPPAERQRLPGNERRARAEFS